MIEFEQESLQRPKSMVSIKVIGIGGAGGNAVDSIIEAGCQGIGFVVANTDAQALEFSKAQHKIQIGVKSTKGLGAGANPEIGKRAAEEDLDKVMEALSGADIVFIIGGMGGGTGSGGLPVIARALREKGILSIAIVTRPFLFEGKRRASVAEAAIERLKHDVDTLIVIPNQKLLEVVDQHVSMIDAFAMINEGILSQSVRGLSDIITRPGHINVDYADIRTIMKDRGLAVMGTGKASGIGRARHAALQAISSPLLENMSVVGAHGVLCNITGGKGLGLHEISEAASVVYEQAHEDANIIIGSVIDENLNDEVIVTIIATDFECPATQKNEEILMEETHIYQEKIMHNNEAALSFNASVPLSLNKEIETSMITDKEKYHTSKHHTDSLEQVNTFGGARDSHDLDIPTFMRQKN
ncbi:MAG TPA: cell division protein FtsZ [Candidatus Babeliales bacterium]|nr:cell division protein FtsZ [Candidatus Babeliales bacterium]